MTTHIEALEAVYLRNKYIEALWVENAQSAQPAQAKNVPLSHLHSEIWAGYKCGDQHIIDKVYLQDSAETKLNSLRYWWETKLSFWTRLVYYFVFCLRPAIFVGTLPCRSLEEIGRQIFPHETQFTTLKRSELLTRGFYNPQSLVDDTHYFDHRPSFYVGSPATGTKDDRQVLCVGWEIDKRYLAYPFLGGICLSTMVAVSIGISSRDIATGAQVGGSLCGVVAAVFCYVVWRCS